MYTGLYNRNRKGRNNSNAIDHGALLEEGIYELGLEERLAGDDLLKEYITELLNWNRVYNLTSVRKPADIVTRHILDSLTLVPHLRGDRILDVGTGEGFLAFRLAKCGFRVLGIDSGSFDYSKDSIQEAQQQAASQGGNVEFRQADIRKLAELDSSFDYVLSSQAVHCMENQRECLQAIHRLLKPGGRFLCIDFLVGLRGFLGHGFHCFLAISREEWVGLLLEHGFGNVRMYELDDYLLVESEKR